MKALKTLVIVLGVMVVAGIAVIGVTIYHRATNLVNSPVPDSPESLAKPAAEPGIGPGFGPGFGPWFGKVALELPPGSRIVEMTAEDARLILRLDLADGGRQILILDLATGKRLGIFELKEGELKDGELRDGAARSAVGGR